jgi:NADH-quinone oxidoreductase subunit M
MAVIAAAVVILTAGYILWAVQRVYLGPEYKGPHPEALVPMTFREFSIAAPLLALAILFGVYPQALLNYMQPSVDKTVVELTEWTKTYERTQPQQRSATVASPVNVQNES